MKKKLLILSFTILALLVVLTFGVGIRQAYAATGCFADTNGYWAETFICWVSSYGIASGTGGGNYSPDAYVTRGQMAVFLQRIAEIPPSTGQIIITGNTYDWMHPNQIAPITEEYDLNYVTFTRSSAGYNFLRITPQVPVVLYGRSVQLVGVEVCYAANANANLADVQVYTQVQTSSPFSGSVSRFLQVATRTDTACRYYVLSAPYTMATDESGVTLQLGVNWLAADDFTVGRATFVFQPTTTTAIAPSALSQDVETLIENQNVIIPSTNADSNDIRPDAGP